jgi:hypothetical protein
MVGTQIQGQVRRVSAAGMERTTCQQSIWPDADWIVAGLIAYAKSRAEDEDTAHWAL